MIDPTKTAERQYEAIARVIEAEGFVKDKIVDALAQRLALECFAVMNKRLEAPAEHYTPLDPVPWDAVTTATKKGS